jgi:hypothetical protein
MALDKDGRPIPVSVPDPAEIARMHQPPSQAALEQNIAMYHRKADEAVQLAVEASQRVSAIEQMVHDRINAKLAEFEDKFDKLTQDRLAEFQRQYEERLRTYTHVGAATTLKAYDPGPGVSHDHDTEKWRG